MEYVTVLEDTLVETGHPLIQELADQLRPYAERLHHLLWGKTSSYTGPLADGYQTHEWISISLLLSDWLVEMLTEANIRNEQVKSVIEGMRNDPQAVASFTVEFLTKLIERDVIQTKDKQQVLLFLQNKLVVNVLLNHVDDLLGYAEAAVSSSCGWCKNKSMKKKSEEDGRHAYQASRRLHGLRSK